MDKHQKIAIVLLPLLTIAILAGGMLLIERSTDAAVYSDGTYTGTGEGYNDKITVEVKIDGGKISSIELLEINDTPGLGDTAAMEIIERIIASQSTDVDVVSGATKTSNGTIQAVKVALGLQEATDEEATEEEATAPPEPMIFEDGIYEGSAAGYSEDGDIKVRVEVVEGKIVSIEILEISDTPTIGDTAAEATIESIMEYQSTDIDTVTGATVSSQGTINAVINAFSNGAISLEELEEMEEGTTEEVEEEVEVVEEETSEEPNQSQSSEEETEAVEEPQEQKPTLKDGTYVGEAKGYSEGYEGSIIRVAVTVKDGKVSRVELDRELAEKTQTKGFGDVAAQEVVDAVNSLNITLENISAIDGIDGMTGATESTDGAKKAIKNALDKAK
ncbi:FMN-binding protein [Alkaliphilus pronyensis]|uniref:FMN-binding protein n=1 Tax=Alkaliphilus pronyensis TaxID=1482732 RepID=A0A6I0FSA9_9FIRM|nr:FMN-binding protein [Alkaliphilus pronyensis]KAB3540973.1 FMN-binding protein [Alkaliphilus pronyensis]